MSGKILQLSPVGVCQRDLLPARRPLQAGSPTGRAQKPRKLGANRQQRNWAGLSPRQPARKRASERLAEINRNATCPRCRRSNGWLAGARDRNSAAHVVTPCRTSVCGRRASRIPRPPRPASSPGQNDEGTSVIWVTRKERISDPRKCKQRLSAPESARLRACSSTSPRPRGRSPHHRSAPGAQARP